MTCEKCWADAYADALHLGGSQTDHYRRLLMERKDNPCTPREQAGQFWNEEMQMDDRIYKARKAELDAVGGRTAAMSDALDELRRAAKSDWHDVRSLRDIIEQAIAAWEKERAEWEEERKEVAVEGVQEVAGFIRDYTRLQDKLNALRAEVQAVEAALDSLFDGWPMHATAAECSYAGCDDAGICAEARKIEPLITRLRRARTGGK